MSKLFTKIVKYVNCFMAICLFAIGIWKIVEFFISSFSIDSIYTMFLPFFLVFMAIMLLVAELNFKKLEALRKYFKFLYTLLGRGIFNIL